MEKRRLGASDLFVTSVCLGTMTWGEQNTQAEAHEQLDYALGRGINFIDAAEMYPVPGKAETQGRTEEYIGRWIKARGKRDDFILASKVTGRSGLSWCRDNDDMTRHTPAQIDEAVEKDEDDMVPLEDILGALHRHVEKGNIRHIGVSNEFPWAVMKFLNLAEKTGGPRLVSNQCAYSLVARRFDYGMPKGSRQALFPQFLGRYASQDAQTAIIECNKTARALGLTPTQFALKFVESRPFVTSNIIGATTMAQLKENIDAHDIDWTSEMEKEAHRLHKTYRSPVA